MSESKVSLFLDTRRAVKEDKFPVKIMVYHNKKQRPFSIEYYFTKQEWDIIQSRSIKKNKLFDSNPNSNDSSKVLEALRSELDKALAKAQSTLDYLLKSGIPFEASDVKDHYSDIHYSTDALQYVKNCHEEYICKLKRRNASISTINGYSSIIRVLAKYYENELKKKSFDSLRLVQMDFRFLRAYETYLKDSLNDSIGTISAHHRYFKALFNLAIREGAIPPKVYPYGKGEDQIIIKSVRKNKKALSQDDFKKYISARKTILTSQVRNYDLAILSFLLYGANLYDIALLTYPQNYDANSKQITFYRQKTYHSSDNLVPISVPLTDPLLELIKLYGHPNIPNDPQNPNHYIFKILKPTDVSKEDIRNRVKATTRAIDKTLKRIAKKIGIRDDLSYGMFRHTHATLSIKEADAGIYDIMVSMGHSSIRTTQLYISSLPEDKDGKMAKYKEKLLGDLYSKS